MEVRQNPPFTAFGPSDMPDMATFSSMMASLMLGSATRSDFSPPTVVATSTAATVVESSASPSEQRTPTTLSTVPSASRSQDSSTATSSLSSSVPSASTASTTAPSATSAANNSEAGSSRSEDCHSISCSPGTQAAVAVPVVVGVLALIGLVAFIARRRRRKQQPSSDIAKEKPNKNWTRHLRIFSFDHELLGGGRFSSSNSMRSGGSSQHIAANSRPRDNPSLHSIDDAAPPYVSHAQPSMAQTGPGLAAGALATTALPRSTSRASAPPPYGQTENRAITTPTTPTAAEQDPFSDAHLAVPSENASPFVDPSEDARSTSSRPAISRNSSMRSGTQHDGLSTAGGSEAGSIREAQVGRHVSVASGGRITHIRNSSQSPPNTD